MLRNIVTIFYIFLLFIVQTTFNKAISIGNISPNLMIILVCCTGFTGEKSRYAGRSYFGTVD